MKARADAGWRVVKSRVDTFPGRRKKKKNKKKQAARLVEGQDRKRDYVDAGLCTLGLEKLRH